MNFEFSERSIALQATMERFFRDAKMNQIGEGTSEVHKNLIGSHVLAQADALPLHPGLVMEPDLWCGEDPGWDAADGA